MTRVLILGGTTEAARLASILTARRELEVINSLAGRTVAPAPLPGKTRIGGFGGTGGLADWLRESRPAALIDATHPFATRIKANAAEASGAVGTPLLHLLRPAWAAVAGDAWHEVESVEAAAEATRAQAPKSGPVFITIGRQELAPFTSLEDVPMVIRSIDPPAPGLLPTTAQTITSAGPFDEAGEVRLMRTWDVRLLVAKNAGGTATYPKIAAARTLGIPVVMVRRPPPPGGAIVETVDAALAWLDQILPFTPRSPR